MSDTLRGTVWRRPWPPAEVLLRYKKLNSEETVEHTKKSLLNEYDNDGNFIGDIYSEAETEDDS